MSKGCARSSTPTLSCWLMPTAAYTVSESIALAKDLLKQDVFWLEEPVHPEYIDDLARIRRRVDLPLVSGEWLGTVYQFRDLLKAEAVDVIMPNYHPLRRFHRHDENRRSGCAGKCHGCPTWSGRGSWHRCRYRCLQRVMPNFLIYEYNQLFNPLRHSVMHETIHFCDGFARAACGRGFGHHIE